MLTNVTLQFENKDLQFQTKDGVQKAVVNIYGRITTMTRRVVQTFRGRPCTMDGPPQDAARTMPQRKSIYQKTMPLTPGHLPAERGGEGHVGGNMNNYEVALDGAASRSGQADLEHPDSGRPDRKGSDRAASAPASS